MYGFVLIAVLAITGGAIAYIGDRLGTKVGKRKLTIFGLRPKHTSILVTIVTGILIAASTLGVMALVSRDVQTALFGMDALKAELSSLSQSVADKNTELAAARTELENKNKEYTALSAKIKETSDKLASISTELASVMGERDRIQLELMRVQSAYDLTRAEKEKEIAALQAIKAELDDKVIALNQDKTSLEQDKAGLESDVDKLNELTNNLKHVFNNVKSGYIIYRAGEIITMEVVPGGEKRADTEYALGQLLNSLNLSLTEKLGIDKNAQVLFISKNEVDDAVDKISNASTDMIVEVISSGNTVAGEPVIVDLEVIPKRMVYAAGTMVYSQIFTAPENTQQAEDILLAFMQNVKKLAIKEGIMPDPIEGKVISIEGAKYFETVKKVGQYQMSGKVQLTAVASNDIYTVGPLRIDIKVQGAP
ncbi:MAG: DUF3084 domain-containing protein [Pelosinus sp.]|nr:DUF3084 domain-containing protein [Pelosinus sp.]